VVMTSAAAPAPGSTRMAVPGGSIDVKDPSTLKTLRYGMGLKPMAPVPDVFILQQKLGIPADGRFGAGTRSAASNYQLAQVKAARPGWTLKDVDGIVGPKTWGALFTVRA